MSEQAAKTGAGPTVPVAVEQLLPQDQRIIQDDLAYRILPFGARAFVWLMRPRLVRDWIVRAWERSAPGIWGGMLCRKRYIDDKLVECIGQVDAVVNLGAGFDTRVYRFPALSKVPVWEVDQPDNIMAKRKRLCKVFGAMPSHVRLVPIDFDSEGLNASLASHGYSMNVRTFFICEAVTQYLTKAGITTLFDFLAEAIPGSFLVFTYIRKDFLDGRVSYGWQKGYEKYVLKDKIWLFGLDPEAWPGFLKQFGWQILEHTGAEELTERYVKPTGRTFSLALLERMIFATKL
jgi:methyltransferase (TIGR00027 family)